MGLPDLTRIVETYIPLQASDLEGYIGQLRRDVVPHLRSIQAERGLSWFSFLLHPLSQLEGHGQDETETVIHLRLEVPVGIQPDAFARDLPPHFIAPHPVAVSAISGLDVAALRDSDWSQGWKLAGDASEWVVGLIEGHEDAISVQQVVQLMHFITNPLMLGHRCLCIPAGFISF